MQHSPFLLERDTENKAVIVAYPLFSSLRCYSMNCHVKPVVCERAFRILRGKLQKVQICQKKLLKRDIAKIAFSVTKKKTY